MSRKEAYLAEADRVAALVDNLRDWVAAVALRRVVTSWRLLADIEDQIFLSSRWPVLPRAAG